jgi:hypothetical protein
VFQIIDWWAGREVAGDGEMGAIGRIPDQKEGNSPEFLL